MNKRIKIFYLAALSLILIGMGLAGVVGAQPVRVSQIVTAPQDKDNLIGIIEKVLWEIVAFVGVIAVALSIAGGYQILTSGGSEEKVKSGRDKILYAVMGMLITLAAWALINLVIKQLS